MIKNRSRTDLNEEDSVRSTEKAAGYKNISGIEGRFEAVHQSGIGPRRAPDIHNMLESYGTPRDGGGS